jgi:hypothetical protein
MTYRHRLPGIVNVKVVSPNVACLLDAVIKVIGDLPVMMMLIIVIGPTA